MLQNIKQRKSKLKKTCYITNKQENKENKNIKTRKSKEMRKNKV